MAEWIGVGLTVTELLLPMVTEGMKYLLPKTKQKAWESAGDKIWERLKTKDRAAFFDVQDRYRDVQRLLDRFSHESVDPKTTEQLWRDTQKLTGEVFDAAKSSFNAVTTVKLHQRLIALRIMFHCLAVQHSTALPPTLFLHKTKELCFDKLYSQEEFVDLIIENKKKRKFTSPPNREMFYALKVFVQDAQHEIIAYCVQRGVGLGEDLKLLELSIHSPDILPPQYHNFTLNLLHLDYWNRTGKFVQALTDYEPEEGDEIKLCKGDVFAYLEEKDGSGEFGLGRNRNRMGWFPVTYATYLQGTIGSMMTQLEEKCRLSKDNAGGSTASSSGIGTLSANSRVTSVLSVTSTATDTTDTASVVSADVCQIATTTSAATKPTADARSERRAVIVEKRNVYRAAMTNATFPADAYFYYKVACRWCELLDAHDAGINVDPAVDAPSPDIDAEKQTTKVPDDTTAPLSMLETLELLLKKVEEDRPSEQLLFEKAMDDLRTGIRWDFSDMPGWEQRPKPPFFSFQAMMQAQTKLKAVGLADQ